MLASISSKNYFCLINKKLVFDNIFMKKMGGHLCEEIFGKKICEKKRNENPTYRKFLE